MEKINSLALQQWQHSARFETPDIGWVLICTALVLLMTPGIAFFYGGLVHRKNALSVLIQVLLTTCIVTIAWATVGYSLALAPSALGGFIGNLDFALLKNIASEPPFAGTSRPATTGLLYMIFMAAFAIIAPAIIVGGCAERMKLSAFAFFAPLWTLLVYCPVAKWIWGNEPAETGFFALQNAGALDFAGGTVVHVNAGVAALVAALMVGKRREPDRKTQRLTIFRFAYSARHCCGSAGLALTAEVLVRPTPRLSSRSSTHNSRRLQAVSLGSPWLGHSRIAPARWPWRPV